MPFLKSEPSILLLIFLRISISMYLFLFFLGRSDPGVESDTSDSRDGPNSPFTVLKKADVELLVGGKKKVYSVVIKVLPTDDVERHTSRRKFSDLLKFSKEVQVYCQALRCMVR